MIKVYARFFSNQVAGDTNNFKTMSPIEEHIKWKGIRTKKEVTHLCYRCLTLRYLNNVLHLQDPLVHISTKRASKVYFNRRFWIYIHLPGPNNLSVVPSHSVSFHKLGFNIISTSASVLFCLHIDYNQTVHNMYLALVWF